MLVKNALAALTPIRIATA